MTRLGGVALAGALLAASCGAPLLKLPAGPGMPAPDAADLLARATARCAGIANISAEVRVSGSLNGRRARGSLLVGLAADAFYIEAPAPFGAPVFVLAARGDDATLLLPRDRRVLEHGVPRDVLEAVTGVPLDVADLRTTLTACPAADPASDAARAFGDDWRMLPFARGEVYLRRPSAAAGWEVAALVYDGPNGWQTDFADLAGGVPHTIRLKSSSNRVDLRLRLSQVDTAASLDPAELRVSIPPGTAAITLDELRAGGPLSP